MKKRPKSMIESEGFAPDSWEETVKACHKAGKQCVLALPAIFRTEAVQYFQRAEEILMRAGFDKMLVRSLEEVAWMREELSMPMIFDHNLYTYNHQALLKLKEQGAVRQTLPLELNSRELLQRGGAQEELIVYGYLPVMVSAQCIKKTVSGCNRKPELLYLKDRMGKGTSGKESLCILLQYDLQCQSAVTEWSEQGNRQTECRS